MKVSYIKSWRDNWEYPTFFQEYPLRSGGISTQSTSSKILLKNQKVHQKQNYPSLWMRLLTDMYIWQLGSHEKVDVPIRNWGAILNQVLIIHEERV